MKNPIKEGNQSRRRKSICDIFSHKWVYHELHIEGKMEYVRHCKRCDFLQRRIYYMGSFIWSYQIRFTEDGAFNKVPDYPKGIIS